MRVVRCLGSLGFGRDLMDVRTPFVLFTLLESLSALSNTSTAARLIRQDLIFQLLSEGKWHWAVFIALQIEDADERQSYFLFYYLNSNSSIHNNSFPLQKCCCKRYCSTICRRG